VLLCSDRPTVCNEDGVAVLQHVIQRGQLGHHNRPRKCRAHNGKREPISGVQCMGFRGRAPVCSGSQRPLS